MGGSSVPRNIRMVESLELNFIRMILFSVRRKSDMPLQILFSVGGSKQPL